MQAKKSEPVSSSVTASCEECGATLPPWAPAGLCPECLLGQAIGALAQSARAGSAAAEPDPVADSSPARCLGHYELFEKIATGGMGVVYKARQVSLDRIVALKMIAPGRLASPESVSRFQAEAEAAASLQHPNIVAIHETGVWEGEHYFSMDYVAGENLADAMRTQAWPPDRVAQVLKTIAEAVHYAHQQGILHRDLKPSNIILDAAGEPHVTDFGLAKRLDDSALSTLHCSLTLTGEMLGSPGFMPPEQAASQTGGADVRSDVYRLGAILYYVLTGRPPFQAASITDTLKQLAESEPIPPRLLNSIAPKDLATICLKCLEKDRLRRYPSAQAVAEELGRFLRHEPILAHPVGLPGKMRRWCRRRPALAGSLLALALTFVLGVVGVLWEWQRAKAGELFARQNEYAADMDLAQRALADNEAARAIRLLEKHRPGFGAPASAGAAHNAVSAYADRLKAGLQTDLRGWEWRYLWQLCHLDEPSTLHRYSNAVHALALSKSGALLAAATRDTVELWDLSSRRPLPGAYSGPVNTLAFSPAGDVLAIAVAGTNRVDLWDTAARKVSKTFRHESEVRSMSFSPDGKLLASFERGGKVNVVDLVRDRPIANLTVTPLRYYLAGVVAFSPDGSRLGIGEEYRRIHVLDLHTGARLVITNGIEGAINALAFSPAGDLIAAGWGYGEGFVGLWDAASGKALGRLTNHTADVFALAFAPDGRSLLAASDYIIKNWDMEERAEAGSLRSSGERLRAVALCPDGRTLVTGGDAGTVRLWNASGSSNRTLTRADLKVGRGVAASAGLQPVDFNAATLNPRVVRHFGMAFTPDSRDLIALDADGTLGLWRVQPFRLEEKLSAFGSNHWAVALSPDGRWLVTGEEAGTLTIWDWAARRAVTNFSAPFNWFGLLRFHCHGRYLGATIVRNDGAMNFRFWRTAKWEEVPLTLPQSATLTWVDLSPDGRTLATGCYDGTVRLFDFPSGQRKAESRRHGDRVSGVHFTPDGRRLLSTSYDRLIKLWDVPSLRELWEMPAPGPVRGGVLSTDGRRCATGGTNPKDAVLLWDLITQRQLLSLQAEGHWFVELGFSPDGNALTAVSLINGDAHLWRALSWEEIEAAEARERF